ncbi:hypothetical protein B0H66DRAFT_121800 [Apodospora peruviana]|uniref:Uncharacterized protein n=1 Tax=Apodospora peruviana TaxID=516989 RepID=A0AAE0MBA7_9PEZI|nr:hypothetical protein B0H66DRAFT_121800 [Apodospora peruviana]
MPERRRVACVDDVDDEGNVIEGTTTYAESHYAPSAYTPSSVASPVKETPNTGRARKGERFRRDASPGTSGLTDSDSTLHPRRRDSIRRPPTSPQERHLSSKQKAMIPTKRPQVPHAKTAPPVPREAVYYGVSPTVTPAASGHRQRSSQPSNRPQSVYHQVNTSSRPPLANSRWYPPPAPLTVPTSYPPAGSWGNGLPYPMPPPSPSPVVTQTPQDYFSRPLEARFGPPSNRPQSSIGFRPPGRPLALDDYPEPEKSLTRQRSTNRRSSRHEGSMAPPPRPASARPPSSMFRPPPTPAARHRAVFDEEDFDGEAGLFHDISPLAPATYEYSAPIPIRSKSRRRPSIDATSIYDAGDYRTEVARANNGRASRRASYYGQSASSGSYEDKMRQAEMYQTDVTGAPKMQLTVDALRKAGRNGGSSRSTKSSGSRDDSEYRRSATTRTTRSSAAEDDMTIRVKGNAVLEVGGANLRCQDGTEINISSRPGGGPTTGFRTSSDKSSYMGQDERRARMERERPAIRNRASSQAASFSRSIPKYDTSPVGGYYDYGAPPPPPYPAYPSVFPISRPPPPPTDGGYF